MQTQNSWPKVYLKPAEYFVSKGGAEVVNTVLGSCISVTFYCPNRRIGGITHALLPKREDHDQEPGRFVDSSIACVLDRLGSMGIPATSLEVKLFGGARMYTSQNRNGSKSSVGRQNIEVALQVLKSLGLQALVTEVGGNRGRKLLFFPHTGEVWIKKLSQTWQQNGGGHG